MGTYACTVVFLDQSVCFVSLLSFILCLLLYLIYTTLVSISYMSSLALIDCCSILELLHRRLGLMSVVVASASLSLGDVVEDSESTSSCPLILACTVFQFAI